ncbi:hypothetical protein CRG98_012734, partial [Punica granatum]
GVGRGRRWVLDRREHVGDGVGDDRSRTRGGHRSEEYACRRGPHLSGGGVLSWLTSPVLERSGGPPQSAVGDGWKGLGIRNNVAGGKVAGSAGVFRLSWV